MNRLASTLLLGLLLTGCGGSAKPSGTVAGKVTFQGAPVVEGNVTFIKVGGGGSGAGVIQSDGTYAAKGVDGMPPGEYVAVVIPPEVTRDRGPNTSPETVLKDMKDIPAKYRSETTSDLKVTIQEGKNDFHIEMK